MTVMTQSTGGGGGNRGSLYDVLELILDRGLVIDVFVRVSLVGIELLTVDARIVVASVDTYLRFAEACNRLDLTNNSNSSTLPELVGDMTEKGAEGKSKGALSGAAKAISEGIQKSNDDADDRRERTQSRTRGTRSTRKKDDAE